MNTQPVEITDCEICGESLEDEERAIPYEAGGWSMCDDCYESDWSYRCGLCDGSESNDNPWKATVIGTNADEVGLTSGIYQIIRWPFLVSNMLSQRVINRSLVRVGDAPEHADDDGHPLCRECTINAIVRRTRSGRWRVTTTYWWRWSWRTKTRVYRTRVEALTRARSYVYATDSKAAL